ncbi:mannosyltransferase family protein [Effusibacillus consociatus]|uniref:Mannosyltransferase family protein n=1 Tax=Effusibacillus consociatus TaxID=1117041 RepID=A0ABV9Q7F0_9BACL
MTRRNAWLYTFALFLLHQFIVIGGSFVFVSRHFSVPSLKEYLQYALIDNFVRWDSLWYIRIAHEGYRWDQPAAFFPLYPYLMGALHDTLGLSYRIAGLLIANAAFLLAIYLLLRLLAMDYPRETVVKALTLLVVFPTSFYFSAVYTESLFLFLTVGCFYCIRERQWLWAGVFGFFASMTRNTGILLVLPFLYEYLADKKFQWKEIRADILLIGLIPAGIAAYMILLYTKIGDPLGFVHAQKYWKRSFLWPWATVWQGTWDMLFKPRNGWIRKHRLIEAGIAYWEILLTGLSLWKDRLRLRWSYSLYLIAAVTVPLLSPSPLNSYFYSIPRFAVVIFPLFVIWALLLRQNRWLIPVIVISIVGQWYLLDKFTTGYFVF